jgi:hypothetical protein
VVVGDGVGDGRGVFVGRGVGDCVAVFVTTTAKGVSGVTPTQPDNCKLVAIKVVRKISGENPLILLSIIKYPN